MPDEITMTERVVLWHCPLHTTPVRWRDDRIEGEVTLRVRRFGELTPVDVVRKGWVRDPERPSRYFDLRPRPSTCPECGMPGRFRVVKAETTSTLCDVRCTMATSPGCQCSCGGKNHGIDLRIGGR